MSKHAPWMGKPWQVRKLVQMHACAQAAHATTSSAMSGVVSWFQPALVLTWLDLTDNNAECFQAQSEMRLSRHVCRETLRCAGHNVGGKATLLDKLDVS